MVSKRTSFRGQVVHWRLTSNAQHFPASNTLRSPKQKSICVFCANLVLNQRQLHTLATVQMTSWSGRSDWPAGWPCWLVCAPKTDSWPELRDPADVLDLVTAG